MAYQAAAEIQARLKYAELLLRKGMQEEACAQLRELVRDEPQFPRGWYTLAVLRAAQGFAEEAVELFQQALGLAPDDVKAWNGLGVALQQLGRSEEAAGCYREALLLDPRYQDARINFALILQDHGRLCAAERELAEGLRLEPDSVRLSYNLANALHFQGRSLEAVAAYRETLRLDPEHLDAQQNLLFALHYSPSFSDQQIFQEHLLAATKRMFHPGEPAPRAAAVGPVAAAEATSLSSAPGRPAPDRPWPAGAPVAGSGRRIRIGYLSPDFRDHAVARFIEPILSHHDRSRFEVFCYANLARPDQTTERLKGLCDQWRDIYGLRDDQAAGMIVADGIDILVDLAGHTSGNRLPLFARRPASVQLTWIGYPDTTGLPQMDYRITDALADPFGEADLLHSERLLRLPRSFSCYQPPGDSPEVGPLPSDAAGRVTFGSFNNLAKVSPEVIELWSRVLHAVPNSRMLMKCRPLGDAEVCVRIRQMFQACGIGPERVELHGGNPVSSQHLLEYHRVDIALDTFPYNGTTTTCEALWMGVPVVSLAGTRHAARTGASLLANCGLAYLVASNAEEFCAIAAGLAQDAGRLRELRAGLRGRMRRSALLDGAGITRELEACLEKIVEER